MTKPTEMLFYHLERTGLDKVLPNLLEKTLERGWRAVVQSGSQERLDALDTYLWTYKEDSFLPHGTGKDGSPADQPVYLTTEDESPNAAQVCFLVEGAETADLGRYARVVELFDGNDPAAVEHARAQWKRAKAAGCEVTYWQQAESGRWEKKA